MQKILFILMFSVTMNLFAQSPNWTWAKTSNETSSSSPDNKGKGIARDANGNSYITGYFTSTDIIFGGITITNSGGGGGLYIVKYNANGDVVWAKTTGGSFNDDEGLAVAADASGNCYVTGYFTSPTVTFGTTTLTKVGSTDMFIVKINTSGVVQWAKSAGGASGDGGSGIAVDGSGNSYVSGYFWSPTITFGSTTLVNADNTGNYTDIFLVKYDASGTVVWAKSAGGTTYDFVNGIAADVSGNTYITGYFENTSVTFGSTTISSAGLTEIFIVKYNTSGTVVWAKSAGGTSADLASGIAVDGSGNSYITGNFYSSTISFGSIAVNKLGADYDMFVAKYDASGTAVWAKAAGGSTADAGSAIGVDASGNSFVTGYFKSSTINFGGASLTNVYSAGTSSDLFVAKYDAAGTAVWAIHAGENANDEGSSIAVDGNGSSCITGYFQGASINFGGTTLSSGVTGASKNTFIAKICQSTTSYLNPVTCGNYTSPSGNVLTMSGTYQDIIPNAAGCDSIITINLIINPSHYSTVYDSVSNTFNLTVDSIAAYYATAYHWDFGDGNTSSLAAPSHIYTIDTTYYVCMRIYTAAGDSCEFCDSIGKDWQGNIIRDGGFTLNVNNPNSTVSIPEVQTPQNIVSVYPNPFCSQTTISFSEVQKSSTLKIIDVLGKEINEINFTGKELILEKGIMKNGIYFLQLTDENNNVTNKKIIIQ